MRRLFRVIRIIAVLTVLVAATAQVTGQTPARQQAADLSRELMSPYCPGKLLADCTSSLAGDLRTRIRTRLEAGDSKATVKADLVREFGTDILGAPPAEGVGWLAWLVPAILAVVTAGAIAWKVVLAARAGAQVPVAAGAGAVDRETLTRLDDELRDLE